MDKSVRRLPVTDLATQMQSDHHSDVMQQMLDHLHQKTFRPPANNGLTGNIGIRRTLQLGMYWSSSVGMPTSYTVMLRPVVTATGSAYQVMNAAETMPVAGSILSVQGFCNGNPGGTWWLGVFKNGGAMGLEATGTGQGISNTAKKGALTFAPGDFISAYIKGSASGMNQSFSASIDIESVA